MVITNTICCIVKILENPSQKFLNKSDRIIPVTKFRANLPQFKENTLIHVYSWGKLSYDVIENFKINDYIIIEGFISIRNIPSTRIKETFQRIEINIVKAYLY